MAPDRSQHHSPLTAIFATDIVTVFVFRPMFGGMDSELKAAFGASSEPTLSYTAKSTGATLESQLGPEGGESAGYTSMALSLGNMVNNSMQQCDAAEDLSKYNNMQKFMTSALCKSDQQSNNMNATGTIANITDEDLLTPDSGGGQHRYQNHCGFDGGAVDVRPYAVALYDFVPQFENELGLRKGDVVWLLQHVDADWVEGELDGERGILPAAYISIVVDILAKPALAELEVLLCDSFYLVAGHSYRVVFSFAGERPGDLAVCQGELVTVVSHSDQHWCSVMNSRSHESYFILSFPPRMQLGALYYSRKPFIIDNLSD